ncbi:hypothetical protein O6H91_07G054500 [Diphasiastrum complanatum]|uniref:Uncharacterized protein n=1 Tax=Diphasiastrum complanatum TaxID=34168 RepID=A0ACC2D5S3_DIPCM|nr:hypothetical protein O6H91_Y540200 [Diphasiastrum complanatum]KAJ7549470.1 hypothetical protein O6H91_07G054500 [Diphasiastrum complanatum]
MAGVSSRIAAAALTLGASAASVYGYATRASHSHAESMSSCQELSQNDRNNLKSTGVPQDAGNQMTQTRAGNVAPVCGPQFDGLNFYETIIIPAKRYRS